jgi:hypothetical protein
VNRHGLPRAAGLALAAVALLPVNVVDQRLAQLRRVTVMHQFGGRLLHQHRGGERRHVGHFTSGEVPAWPDAAAARGANGDSAHQVMLVLMAICAGW